MEDLDEVYKGQRISKEVIVHTQSKENIIFDFDHSMILILCDDFTRLNNCMQT